MTISAEVILKSKTGQSMTNTSGSITKENVKEFEPSGENLEYAINTLKELGFNVFRSGLTLTITGDLSLFEKIFKTKLNVKKNENGHKSINPSKELDIPEKLSKVIERIVFPPPTEFFK